MPEPTDRPRTPIPRGAAARDRLLRAALDLLADEGVGGFTMEAVAARAGASKATVYRRWSARAELLAEAMERISQTDPTPETGELRSDLGTLLIGMHTLLSTQPFPRLLSAFIDAAERDPALATLHVELSERRREPLRQVLQRARQRAEIPHSADIELAIDLLTGPTFLRRLILHRQSSTAEVYTIVDYVLAALRHAPPVNSDNTDNTDNST
ncbi:TetR/AcrR family transcriptional regulator [Kribbella albertanoniae]|uniref:TetR/AcrR family transcriptional regulator n=1 Tax=Kribbella albertanoniae TaxID=1266829 RepID=UPI001EE0B564|nr:TetR/AcrR family transcriptional regulator [Kribbella albertanoniae]